ncbi:phosphotransferase [Dactylosporangium sp. NPDC005555]|uniref:phosphotransferase enzyme family protein n=1 Tax=Dactylosporangium sp. NPDC005555 TaxID=3154889 RepID=UPI0033BAE27F
MTTVRWMRSLAAPEDIGALVAARCGLTVTGCELVRSLTNDVYRVRATGGDVACKVYGAGRWSVSEVAWEQDLAAHLAAHGVTAATPVPLDDAVHGTALGGTAVRDTTVHGTAVHDTTVHGKAGRGKAGRGTLVGTIDAPEGIRPFTVTAWATSAKPRPPWSDALFHRYGAALARFHLAADSFVSDHPARTGDPLSTLDQSLRWIGDPMVHEVAAAARPFLTGVVDIGVRHGDASLDNIQVTDGGVLLWHDFDLAGVGPRAADLTGAHGGAHWDTVLDGYTTLRPIDTGGIVALRVVELVRNIAWHLRDKVAMRGTESVGEGWVDRELESLRELRDRL